MLPEAGSPLRGFLWSDGGVERPWSGGYSLDDDAMFVAPGPDLVLMEEGAHFGVSMKLLGVSRHEVADHKNLADSRAHGSLIFTKVLRIYNGLSLLPLCHFISLCLV
jgi:hypothetical protein